MTMVLMASSGCPTAPPPTPVELHPLSHVPAKFWAQADGRVRIDDEMTVPGRVRIWYSVDHEGVVEVEHLYAWMDDVDLAVTFLWWDVEVEPLRCTTLRNQGVLTGTLNGTEIQLASGAAVEGISYSERGENGKCVGKARKFEVEATDSILLTHDPENNRFAFEAAFETMQDEHAFTISFAAEGRYLNRPPIAAFEIEGVDAELNEEGCPGTTKDNPPIAIANTPEGLSVTFHSSSWDPDGLFPPGTNPKRPRVDIAFEQWARSGAEGLRPVGSGRTLGPILFETGREHQLLLWISDRQGAESRKFCHFQVMAPS